MLKERPTLYRQVVLGFGFAGFAIAGGAACRAKTELDVTIPRWETTESGDDAASADDAADVGPYPLCSLHAGPVGSCDAGVAAGPVRRCDAVDSFCSDRLDSPLWGCCSMDSQGRLTYCVYAVPDLPSCQ